MSKNRQKLFSLFFILSFMLPIACSSPTPPPHRDSSTSNGANNTSPQTIATPVTNNNNSASGGSGNSAGGFQYEIRDQNHVQDGQWLKIFANVVNKGTDTFIGTRYQLSLLDNNGNVVATDQIPTQTDIVPPGKSSPIWFSFDNPPAWSNYEIIVSQQGQNLADFGGEVVDVSVTPATGSGICGEYTVTNHDDVPTSFIFVAERYVDGSGRIRDVIVQGPGNLSPGQSVTDSCFYADGPYELTAIAWHITK